jgi:hypothetical protein
VRNGDELFDELGGRQTPCELVRLPGPEVDDVGVAVVPAGFAP